MGKTFEALMKAEKESQKRLKEVAAFESKPFPKRLGRPEQTIPQQILEEYQRLKYNLLHTHSGKGIKALLFTSPSEGEDHSPVLINFAMALASEGDKVLLVDANLRNPSFHHVFNLEKKSGLTDLLSGKSPLLNVVKETQTSHLSVITCGMAPSNPSSAFELNALDSYIQEMKAEYDWVLFDSPPINSSNDSIALAPRVDGVVMVVQAEKTRWEVAEKAKQRIEGGNGTILGVILNNRRFHIPDRVYKAL